MKKKHMILMLKAMTALVAMMLLFSMASYAAKCRAGAMKCRIQFNGESGKGITLKGSRVILVKARVADELRKAFPWWDDSRFTAIAARWSNEKGEALPGSIVTESDVQKRKEYCNRLSAAISLREDLPVISCVGDSDIEGTINIPEWCRYWVACYRDEAQILRKESDDNRSTERFLTGMAKMYSLLETRDSQLAQLNDELEDHMRSRALLQTAKDYKTLALSSEIRAEKFHKEATALKTSADGYREKYQNLEKVLAAITSDIDIDNFLAISQPDAVTVDLVRTLKASGQISTVTNLASWFSNSRNSIQEPFRSNIVSVAIFDQEGSCSFRGIPPGDYYLIIQSLRSKDRQYFVCKRLAWKTGVAVISDNSLYRSDDWGLLRKVFSPYLSDPLKKAAIEDVQPEEMNRELRKAPWAVNMRDSRGMTPLHYAVKKQDAALVALLADRGADMNIADESKRTALHWAVIKASEMSIGESSRNTIQVLLDKGADPNSQNRMKQTALHLAIWGHCSTSLVSLLLEKGADPNQGDEDEDTALHYAARTGYADVVTLLARKGADVTKVNSNGDTPLALAEFYSKQSAVAVLKKELAVKETEQKVRELFTALADDNLAQVRALIGASKDLVNAREKGADGRMPLHVAVNRGDLDMVRYLVSKGAQVNCRDLSGATPLSYAIKIDEKEVADFLKTKGGIE